MPSSDKPNLMTPTGLVHRATIGLNPYSNQRGPSPACGKTRARYLVPTDAPVTCKRCGPDENVDEPAPKREPVARSTSATLLFTLARRDDADSERFVQLSSNVDRRQLIARLEQDGLTRETYEQHVRDVATSAMHELDTTIALLNLSDSSLVVSQSDVVTFTARRSTYRVAAITVTAPDLTNL